MMKCQVIKGDFGGKVGWWWLHKQGGCFLCVCEGRKDQGRRKKGRKEERKRKEKERDASAGDLAVIEVDSCLYFLL